VLWEALLVHFIHLQYVEFLWEVQLPDVMQSVMTLSSSEGLDVIDNTLHNVFSEGQRSVHVFALLVTSRKS